MKRMKWFRDSMSSDQRSECGRFIVRRFCTNPKWSGYWGLTDTKTGQEYPCRTESSAKSGARNILKATPTN
jgi:hypothetical protein